MGARTCSYPWPTPLGVLEALGLHSPETPGRLSWSTHVHFRLATPPVPSSISCRCPREEELGALAVYPGKREYGRWAGLGGIWWKKLEQTLDRTRYGRELPRGCGTGTMPVCLKASSAEGPEYIFGKNQLPLVQSRLSLNLINVLLS